VYAILDLTPEEKGRFEVLGVNGDNIKVHLE
jgi:hypothetical protein